MRRIMTLAASTVLALAMLVAPDMVAQTTTRSSGGTTTRSTGTSSQTTRSSGSVSSSQSTTRSSGTVSSSQNTTRSSGSTTRSTGSASSGSSTTRSSGSVSSSQNTRSSGSTTRSSGSVSSSQSTTRSSGNVSSSSSTTRSSGSTSGSTTRSSGSTVRSGGNNVTSSGSTARSSASSGNSVSSGTTARSSASTSSSNTVKASNVSRSGLGLDNDSKSVTTTKEVYRDAGGNYRYNDDYRIDHNHNMLRVAPRERAPMPWDRPGYFWGDHPHYYGYRITSLPPSWRRISHWGIDYYFYNGIYYRSYGGTYVVCRPPFGTPLEVAIDRAILNVIRFAYYCDTYRTYSRTFDYYNVIARQNLIIAQQNARLIHQNTAYALNASRALTAYELAEKLGLVQSYAYANSNYYYQDGVFYTISASGVYSTIVPPAGALVTSLPDDYEIIVMNGIEYYLVDNTVYRTTVFEGHPYLEVLGQMYGSLYSQYNIYR